MTTSQSVGLRKYLPELDDYAMAIGWACIELVYLENLLDSCLWMSLGIPKASTMNCITANSDINQKTMMLKGLAFQNKKSDTWFAQTRSALDEVKGLQERRNRFVHDHWVPELARKRVAIQKPQSRQPETLVTHHSKPVGVREIWKLVEDISATHSKIFDSFTELYGVLEPVQPR